VAALRRGGVAGEDLLLGVLLAGAAPPTPGELVTPPLLQWAARYHGDSALLNAYRDQALAATVSASSP
jgi:hypothetical protein